MAKKDPRAIPPFVLRRKRGTLSFNDEMDSAVEGDFETHLECEEEESAYTEFVTRLSRAIDSIADPRLQSILYNYWGGHTQAKLAYEFGISQGRVSQLKRVALGALRAQLLNDAQLRQYLNEKGILR